LHNVQNGKVKGKGKVHPRTGLKGPEREKRYSSTLPLTLALDGDGWSMPRPGRFTPGKDPVLIVQEAEWVPRPVWTGVENLAPPGIRSPVRSACSELLYQLHHPAIYITQKAYQPEFSPVGVGTIISITSCYSK